MGKKAFGARHCHTADETQGIELTRRDITRSGKVKGRCNFFIPLEDADRVADLIVRSAERARRNG